MNRMRYYALHALLAATLAIVVVGGHEAIGPGRCGVIGVFDDGRADLRNSTCHGLDGPLLVFPRRSY